MPADPVPGISLPAGYEHAPAAEAGAARSLATDVAWQDYFADPYLRELIAQALQNNRSLRIAALRVQEAQAAYGVQRSASLPAVGLGADVTRSRTPADLSITGNAVTGSQFQAGVGINNWEIDFWGRIASLNEAALQDFLATNAGHRATGLSLVAQVANAYLSLRELDERLRLAQATEASQRESLRIFTRRFEVGSASRLELTQVQTLLAQAESLVVQLQQQRATQRNALEVLLGAPAGIEWAGAPDMADEQVVPALAAGVPSDLLRSRPDIIAAEHQLRAANASIGAARAAFFPRISLTAFGGTASSELEGLFKGPGRAWNFAPSLSLPIFDAGRNQASLDLAQVRGNIAIVEYEQAIQNAFRDVADALAAQHWLQRQVGVQQTALDIQKERARLSRLSYDHGASAFLEVLDAERDLLSAEQQLAQTRRALLSSRVALYAALGGGARHLPDAPLLPAAPNPAPAPAPVE